MGNYNGPNENNIDENITNLGLDYTSINALHGPEHNCLSLFDWHEVHHKNFNRNSRQNYINFMCEGEDNIEESYIHQTSQTKRTTCRTEI